MFNTKAKCCARTSLKWFLHVNMQKKKDTSNVKAEAAAEAKAK